MNWRSAGSGLVFRVSTLLTVAILSSACGMDESGSGLGVDTGVNQSLPTHNLDDSGDAPTALLVGVVLGDETCFQLVPTGEKDGPAILWPAGSMIEGGLNSTITDGDGDTLAIIGEEVTLSGGYYERDAAAEFVSSDLPTCGDGSFAFVFGPAPG